MKRTSCREGILEVILEANQALSEHEIRERLQGNYDRTTFYRSFKTLEESKIIHKIVVDNLLVKYAIDISATNKHKHAHFYCNECNKVVCLDSVAIQKPILPDGYSEVETEMIIKGVCKYCKQTDIQQN
ncbi:MAG: transcriptional repressor [Bacteroidales bacterium]|nr:transcriptional repressor [Bacteroidales bacterium]